MKANRSHHCLVVSNVKAIRPAGAAAKLARPFVPVGISAGFPSPAESEMGIRLDFNKHFIKHPSATFYVQVIGDSMIERRIDHGDILLVDRVATPKDGSVIIARINADFCVRVLRVTDDGMWLDPANKKYKSIEITAEMDFEIWGTVILTLVRP
jgi:DNA polymerase V